MRDKIKHEDYCSICEKGIPEDEIYHICGDIGHIECFQKAITAYPILKDKIKRRNKQIKKLKKNLIWCREELFKLGIRTDFGK